MKKITVTIQISFKPFNISNVSYVSLYFLRVISCNPHETNQAGGVILHFTASNFEFFGQKINNSFKHELNSGRHRQTPHMKQSKFCYSVSNEDTHFSSKENRKRKMTSLSFPTHLSKKTPT